jgi:hypothetical protein
MKKDSAVEGRSGARNAGNVATRRKKAGKCRRRQVRDREGRAFFGSANEGSAGEGITHLIKCRNLAISPEVEKSEKPPVLVSARYKPLLKYGRGFQHLIKRVILQGGVGTVATL